MGGGHAYVDKMQELSAGAMARVVSMGVSDHGHGLFELLDADGDGLISVEEAMAYDKLKRNARKE